MMRQNSTGPLVGLVIVKGDARSTDALLVEAFVACSPGSMHDDLDVGAAPSRDAAGQPRARAAPVTGGGVAAPIAAATAASPRR